MIRINGTISYIEAGREPLSADVGVIRGKSSIWLYDVGNSGEAREEIRNLLSPAVGTGAAPIPCLGDSAVWSPRIPTDAAFVQNSGQSFCIVLSHFHPDHIGNLSGLPDPKELFVGENTRKYTKKGTAVTGDLYLEDGCQLHLFPLPSTHARGSLGLEVNGEYAFLGDGLYPGSKGGRSVYNAQILREEIGVLKALEAHTFLISHQSPFARSREETILRLEEIYSRRKKDQPYIEV